MNEQYGFGMVLAMFLNSPIAKMARAGWNGKNQYIQMQAPDENSKMTTPYMYITTTNGDVVPWVPSQGDLFAMDWEIVTEPKEITEAKEKLFNGLMEL